MSSRPFILPANTAGLSEAALWRAKDWYQRLLELRAPDVAEEVSNKLWATPLSPVHQGIVDAWERTLRDLGRLDSFDWALRLLVDRMLGYPSDWGDVEGVTAHMSHRGYCELQVWTTKVRGGALEINIGNRFAGNGRMPTFAAYEERCRTHGRPETSLYVKTKDGSAAAQFIIDALAATEPGALEQLAASHKTPRTT